MGQGGSTQEDGFEFRSSESEEELERRRSRYTCSRRPCSRPRSGQRAAQSVRESTRQFPFMLGCQASSPSCASTSSGTLPYDPDDPQDLIRRRVFCFRDNDGDQQRCRSRVVVRYLCVEQRECCPGTHESWECESMVHAPFWSRRWDDFGSLGAHGPSSESSTPSNDHRHHLRWGHEHSVQDHRSR